MKIDLQTFDSIIFDFGGVILDIDPQRTINAFAKIIPLSDVQKIENSGILDEIEKGQISQDELILGVNAIIDKNILESEFLKAWNAILLDYKPERIKAIQELKKTHKLYLLSNTNEIHFKNFSLKLFNEYGLSFTDLFLKPYLSFEMGLLKPELEIYQQLIDEEKLNPEKTLFIEDTEANAIAAQKLGIQTLVIPRNGTFYDFFE